MKRLKGEDAFDQFYSKLYPGRWDELKRALLSEKNYVAYYNPYLVQDYEGEKKSSHLYEKKEWDAPSFIGELKNYYLLDYASTLPVKALEVNSHDTVIDLCAAPGGKSLMIMGHNPLSLVCNDLSHQRLQRLKKTMQDYLPTEQREKITYTKRDASKWGLFEKNVYSKTLLDAPCSSERHFLEKKELMQDWSEGRSRRLAMLQFSLLAAAIDITQSGGSVVYSTCSISHWENDEVIRKALKKREGKFEVLPLSLEDESERTEFGIQFLPDKSKFGPFYLCKLRIC